MAKVLNFNRTDTAVSGVTSLTIPTSVLNYAADFRVREDGPNEAILTNLSSPIDKPEKFRYAMSEIRDVYRGSGLDASMYAPSKRGASVLCQLTDTWTVTDSADPSYVVGLPMEGHIVLRVPANELITADIIKTFVGRIVSGLFETGTTDSGRLNSLFRGSLLPKDL